MSVNSQLYSINILSQPANTVQFYKLSTDSNVTIRVQSSNSDLSFSFDEIDINALTSTKSIITPNTSNTTTGNTTATNSTTTTSNTTNTNWANISLEANKIAKYYQISTKQDLEIQIQSINQNATVKILTTPSLDILVPSYNFNWYMFLFYLMIFLLISMVVYCIFTGKTLNLAVIKLMR